MFVGLSGGVDSSVAAYLLKKRGFDVTGVHLRCWNREGCDVREAEDARRVAEKLDIPFYVFNLEKEYREKVVEYMVQGYARGETPNPDVMCNKEIKFGLFLEKALSLGADYVATGHYVKLSKVPCLPAGRESPKSKVVYKLLKADDVNKDQSYFLWTLTQKQLCHCLFPIGDYLKPEVRKIAKKAGFSTADKKDSQGICFLGKVTLPEFLSEFLPAKKGDILDAEGKVLGKHKGVQFYTIGQRHGICVPGKKPYYVANKDTKSNTLVIAENEDRALYKKEVELVDVNFINKDYFSDLRETPKKVFVRVRYRQPVFEAVLTEKTDESGATGYFIVFDKPQKFIAKGQSAVFYLPAVAFLSADLLVEASAKARALVKAGSKDLEMLGGGIIK